MAEIVLSAFVSVLLENLCSTALKNLARSKGIHSELEKWESSLSQIQAVLSDASQREITDVSVKRWLNGLQHLAYDIDDVLDDVATQDMDRELIEESGARASKVRKHFPTWFRNFSASTRMNDKLNNITTKLQNLAEEKNTLELSVKVGKPQQMNRRLETSLVDVSSIVGRQGDKEALLQKLLEDEPSNQNVSIVPIVGLGGIGKTTLARLLYNEKQVKDRFELKAWVCVSDEFDIFKMTKIIFQSVAEEDKGFEDFNLLQVALSEKLSKRRFLLVLDDVWSESYADWEILARPFFVAAPGSKIIMTTRKDQLLTRLGYDQPHRLQNLSDEEALSLFSQHALGENNFDSHPSLKPYGEGFVKKCDGLPLAVTALGRLLRTKASEDEWKELLNSEIWRLPQGSGIIPALNLSYHDLPAHLKQLFAYCSLFPKDYMFYKDELVLLWMAEGFLHQPAGSNQMESSGRKYFEELLSRSFFLQVSDDGYMMHDLMNDLAKFVAGKFFFRLDDMDADVKNDGLAKYRHMSFIRQEYGVHRKFKVFEEARSLRTLLALSVVEKEIWQHFYLSNKVLVELLPQLPLLRVLRLSDFEITEVPESIGSLKHLRYLNLSRTRIKHLPEQVGNLYNLQTLLLCGCRGLEKLPRSFSKLKNLRHLDISNTPFLKKMPCGIGKLKTLQTLSKVIIEGANGFAITELKDLKDLHGRLSIERLGKVQNAMDAKNANLLEKELNDLEVEWSDVFDGARDETLEKKVLNLLNPCNDKLQKLKIVSYGGIEFPSWIGDPSFFRLAHVTISGCKKCLSLPPLGQLPLLKDLVVEAMNGVKVVGSELLGSGNSCGGVAFRSLEILRFVNMEGWEVWSTNNGDAGKAFPCLQKLCIERCPNLVKASLEAFPCLGELHIEECGNLVEASFEALPLLRVLDISGCQDVVLRSVVHVASSVTNLEISNISGLTNEMWGGVIGYLGAVEEVVIGSCHDLRYLWESEAEACRILVNLRKLKVDECSNLVRLGEKEEDNCGSSLTSLTHVDIEGCKRLESYNCPNSIEKLWILECESITSVSFPTGGQKMLKDLFINNCSKLMEEESSGGGERSRVVINASMSLLENVCIDNWPNLKSFPSFSCFIHLTKLVIINCQNLESFPDEELPNLTSLTHLRITDCPRMDDSFPRGLWPPNLKSLAIGQLKKPISEWGPQNFPTSLVILWLLGGSCDDAVTSNSQVSPLLPSSLKNLEIGYFEKLESLSMGLQYLTSLLYLNIDSCPNLKDLPETPLPSLLGLCIKACPNLKDLPELLLPSLLRLDICNCPKLKERCSRRGSQWPLISHIPCIQIDGELCN